MFCPNCGIDEKQPNQFCRACGTNLLPVREVVERPDGVTASAITAREEIGRAVAAKIRETQSVYELKKVAEDVLPEIEKFLESPEERRLRRIRTGTILSLIGLGVAVAMSIVPFLQGDKDFFLFAGLGVVTFFIGMAFVINGYVHTVLGKSLDDRSSDAERQRVLDGGTNDLSLPDQRTEFVSVVENTTKHLAEKRKH